MDGRLVYGTKEASSFVTFDDPSVPVVKLTVEATVVPVYYVRLDPPRVLVPRATQPGTERSATIKVTETLSHSDDYERETSVTLGKVEEAHAYGDVSIVRVVCLADRLEGGQEKLAESGLTLTPVFTRDDFGISG